MKKKTVVAKTKSELMKLAQRLGLRGVSTLKKEQLNERVQRARTKAAAAESAEEIKRRAIRKRANGPETVGAAAFQPAPQSRAVPKQPAVRAKTAAPKVRAKPVVPAVPAASEPVSPELSANKFALDDGTKQRKQVFADEHLGELPESYGTARLFLTPRDPHWLFAYWDLSGQQMADCRQQAADGRLLLRIWEKNQPQPLQELTLQHDTRNWYIPVNKAATTYSAELGFWRHDGSFNVVSRSREATTPADAVSPDTTARFVTIPLDISFAELLKMVQSHATAGAQLADVLHELQTRGFKFPFKVGVDLGPWSAAQTAELERLLGGDVLRKIWMGSFEITEWLRRRLQEELSSGLFSAFSPAGASWSGGLGLPQPGAKGFWFAVNAELIIYGATEPTAKVTIDGKPVKLANDGTFSFHYTFPDGQYKLPVVAVSAAGDDQRAVELQFERKTVTQGAVGKVKQPAGLKAPAAQ